ncbi:hypothetical protein M9Y10_044982 [Tritrichomonas musculus]|uniref:Uncharacterized protein n=1 Tax=Tritrichomonas musculus TaxID=1915356 RepID=A0ABR2JU66_9EUKA
MLFTFSGEEWSNNFLRFYHTFKLLYEARNKKEDDHRFIKVSQVLGLNIDGFEVPQKKEYSPIYKRLEDKVPTTTNHVESMHKQLNGIIKSTKLSIQLRLAYIIKYIIDRTLRIDITSRANLRTHFRNLQQKAQKEVSKDKDSIINYSQSFCSCYKQIYYSVLYWTTILCIHTILNDEFEEDYYIDQLKKLDFNFSFQKHDLKIYDIETNLSF